MTTSTHLFPILQFTLMTDESIVPLVIPADINPSSLSSYQNSHVPSPTDCTSMLVITSTTDRRTSIMPSRPPVWLRDYQTRKSKSNFVCLYPMSKHISYANLSISHRSALAPYYSICEPSTFEEASLDPKWIEAMKSEILALEESNTWSVVDLPPGKDSIGCKWVF